MDVDAPQSGHFTATWPEARRSRVGSPPQNGQAWGGADGTGLSSVEARCLAGSSVWEFFIDLDFLCSGVSSRPGDKGSWAQRRVLASRLFRMGDTDASPMGEPPYLA
jgi:hypothetical protein